MDDIFNDGSLDSQGKKQKKRSIFNLFGLGERNDDFDDIEDISSEEISGVQYLDTQHISEVDEDIIPEAPDTEPTNYEKFETPAPENEELIVESTVPLMPLFQAPEIVEVVSPSGNNRSKSIGNQKKKTNSALGQKTTKNNTAVDEQNSNALVIDESIKTHKQRKRRQTNNDSIDDNAEGDNLQRHVKGERSAKTGPDSKKSTQDVKALEGSTRLEAKKKRKRDIRQPMVHSTRATEPDYAKRDKTVDRQMIVKQSKKYTQIGVLENGILVEHFVSSPSQKSLNGNVYLGKVQNVLPSMEAAFIDIGQGRNAILYAGEVNWDGLGLKEKDRKMEKVVKPGDMIIVQVTKDSVGQKGARLTNQISLPGRYLVYVPETSMTGISRKLPDSDRQRLRKILKENLPEKSGAIVRTASIDVSEEELRRDINRLKVQWEQIYSESKTKNKKRPHLLYAEPEVTLKVVRDVFNEDFSKLVVSGERDWDEIEAYVTYVAPDLLPRLHKWNPDKPIKKEDRRNGLKVNMDHEGDIFEYYRINEQIKKGLSRKVYLPSGGSLVIDKTEAMTVIDVNTGRFVGSGGNLEETVSKNNIEAAEEIVRQLRLRDIGGIIVVDFIDMILESNRDLVRSCLLECLSRDRTRHQVSEITSLGLVQMTRKKIGSGLLETFSEECSACHGNGKIIHQEPFGIGRHKHNHQQPAGKHNPPESEEFEDRELSEVDKKKQESARKGLTAVARATEKKTEQEHNHKRRKKTSRQTTLSAGDQAHLETNTAEDFITSEQSKRSDRNDSSSKNKKQPKKRTLHKNRSNYSSDNTHNTTQNNRSNKDSNVLENDEQKQRSGKNISSSDKNVDQQKNSQPPSRRKKTAAIGSRNNKGDKRQEEVSIVNSVEKKKNPKKSQNVHKKNMQDSSKNVSKERNKKASYKNKSIAQSNNLSGSQNSQNQEGEFMILGVDVPVEKL